MGGSTDLKVARTRQAIFAAVEQLVNSGNTAVTVSDIVRSAQISRSAFYTHFAGIDELAIALLSGAFSEIGDSDLELRRAASIPGIDAARIAVSRLVDHMVRYRSLYIAVLGLPQSSSAYDRAVAEFALHVRETSVLVSGIPADVNVDDAAHFVASGSFALMMRWLRSAHAPSTEEMERRLVALMPNWLISPDPLGAITPPHFPT